MNEDNIKKAANDEFAGLEAMFKATQVAEVHTACVSLYQIYKGYMEAGFDADQAMELVKTMLAIAIHKNNNGSDE